jgi:WD40 repeat protein
LSRSRLATLALTAAFPLLAGCGHEPVSTLDWSADGGRLGFLDDSGAGVYDLTSRRLERLDARRYGALAWSPAEPVVAVATGALVEVYSEQDGRFRRTGAWTAGEPGGVTGLMWHPSGRKLLVLRLRDGSSASTWELDLGSGTAAAVGPGLGFYGPGGDWLLWHNTVAIGSRASIDVFDRQRRDGERLPLPPGTRSGLESENFELLVHAVSERSARPFCVLSGGDQGPSTVYCLDEGAALKRVGLLPAGTGRYVYPNPQRSLYAAVTIAGRDAALGVFDAAGRRRADGRRLLDALAEERPRLRAEDPSRLRVSRLAWSPDGNWLAWVVEGRLALWNWRNDVVVLPGR